jgi:ABC-type phosphate transport system auxiliary subunit
MDKQTQSLPLEQKRGRGRPATGQALSNAERQRRYREAQKTQRNEIIHKEVAEDLRAQLAEALEDIEFLNRTNIELLKQLGKQQDQLAQRNDNEQMKRVELAEAERDTMGKELAKARAKISKAGQTKRRYVLQWQDSQGDWHDDSTGDFGSKKEAEEMCGMMNKSGVSDSVWRVRERQWV